MTALHNRFMSMSRRRSVNKCLRITARDNVTIFFYKHNLPLAEEIAEQCFKRGADVMLSLYTDKFYLSYIKELPSRDSLRRALSLLQGPVGEFDGYDLARRGLQPRRGSASRLTKHAQADERRRNEGPLRHHEAEEGQEPRGEPRAGDRAEGEDLWL